MSTVLPAIRPQLICKNPIADSADLLAINRLCDNPTPDIERVLSLLQRYDDALLESQQECEALETIADRDAPAVLDALDDLSTEAANLVCILEDLMPQIEKALIEMDRDRLGEAFDSVQAAVQVAGSYV